VRAFRPRAAPQRPHEVACQSQASRSLCIENSLDLALASQEYERTLALGPGNTRSLRNYGTFAVYMGRSESGLAAARRAVVLDPLSSAAHTALGLTFFYLRLLDEAIAEYRRAESLDRGVGFNSSNIGLAYYWLGNLNGALSSCEQNVEADLNQYCLAITYDKLGRRADAKAMLAKMQALDGDAGALLYAQVYAQWGDSNQALDWLEKAMRLRQPRLERLKVQPALDPLRKEPRFQTIERALKFPD
jgi:tetratricopeptide (TPR) repeat protein